jgi:hypothetical protein
MTATASFPEALGAATAAPVSRSAPTAGLRDANGDAVRLASIEAGTF